MNINATLFVQLVVFFIGAWVTMKYIWPPLIKSLEERQKKIADGLAAADRGQKSLDDAKRKIAEEQATERAHVQQLIGEAEKRGQALVDAAKEQAKIEADRIVEAAKAAKVKTFVWFNYRRCPAVALAHQMVKAGKVRSLGVFAEKRLAGWPDLPTLKEQGVDAVYVQNRGIVAPGGFPADARKVLQDAMKKYYDGATFKKYTKDNFLTEAWMDGETFGKWLESENTRYAGILKEMGLIKEPKTQN